VNSIPKDFIFWWTANMKYNGKPNPPWIKTREHTIQDRYVLKKKDLSKMSIFSIIDPAIDQFYQKRFIDTWKPDLIFKKLLEAGCSKKKSRKIKFRKFKQL
jgi:hypothetical protein